MSSMLNFLAANAYPKKNRIQFLSIQLIRAGTLPDSAVRRQDLFPGQLVPFAKTESLIHDLIFESLTVQLKRVILKGFQREPQVLLFIRCPDMIRISLTRFLSLSEQSALIGIQRRIV